MAKDQSVAPQERINITYRPATGDKQSEVELPLKLLFVGDYTGRPDDDTSVESREPVSIDKDNFQQVLANHKLEVAMKVENTLGGDPKAELAVKLRFKQLSDFAPDAIAAQVPELRTLLQMREALTALKGPMGNVPAFRKTIERILNDHEARKRLLAELESEHPARLLGTGTEEG